MSDDSGLSTTSSGAALLEARTIRRISSRDGSVLLDDVSLRLGAGDRVALCGSTGSGKTVLLRVLSRLDSYDSGQILWRGKIINPQDVPAFRSQVIYLHQRPVLFEGTVRDNLLRPFRFQVHADQNYEETFAKTRFAACELDTSFLDRNINELSGGEAQIVALVRALQLAPTVLLLDEPTASLDTVSTSRVEQLVDDWFCEHPDRRSFLWVTHQVEQSIRIADRVMSMETGRLETGSGPARTVPE